MSRQLSIAPNKNNNPLTPKEQEILQLIALGQTDAEIANQLSRSTKTIGHHIQHIICKLNARNRTDAVVCGIFAGLIHQDKVS